MSFWPKSSPKGARRKKLTAPPDDPPLLAKPTQPGKPPPRKRARLAVQKPVAAAPKKRWSMQIGSGSILSVLALLGLLLAWGGGMTLVLIFGDKLSARLIAQNSEMQDAYEQRLQAYRDEIARVISESEQNKVDKDSVTGRVIELTRRQRALETRQNMLNKLTDLIGVDPASAPATTGAPPAVDVPIPPVRPGFPTRAPSPPGQTRGDLSPPPDAPSLGADWAIAAPEQLIHRAAQRDSPAAAEEPSRIHTAQLLDLPTFEAPPTQSEIELEAQVARLERAVAQVDAAMTRSLGGMVKLSDLRLGRYRSALGVLGLTPEGVAPETGRPSANLPAIIIPLAEQNTPFAARINEIRGNVSLLYRLRPALSALPLNRPTTTEARFASPFGYRIHPISHVRKLHAGLDLAAPVGTPIRAAGAGVVLSAGWGGGYGNLVQVDHGNGVITRYAHMSAIEVAQGQPVALGAIVGRMGSTGASTGSHLHFETRVKGTPTNPTCFLIAGDKLRDAPSPGFVCEKPPFTHESASQEDEDDDS